MSLVVHPPIATEEPTAYRTITLTDDGRVLASGPLAARNDDEAISLTTAMKRGAGIDLWDGLRFMAHFGPEPVRV
jgi:hypothetical protein